ncbi:unnamed protein product [Rhizopus stolonifer]
MSGRNRQLNGQRKNQNPRPPQRPPQRPREQRDSRDSRVSRDSKEPRDYKYLIVENLNKQTIASTLFDYFMRFVQVENAVLNTNEVTEALDGTATITFRQIPRGSD